MCKLKDGLVSVTERMLVTVAAVVETPLLYNIEVILSVHDGCILWEIVKIFCEFS